MAASKRKKRTSNALAGTLSAFNPKTEQNSSTAEALLSTEPSNKPEPLDSTASPSQINVTEAKSSNTIADTSTVKQQNEAPLDVKTSPTPKERFNQISHRLTQYLEDSEQTISHEQLAIWVKTLDKRLSAQRTIQSWLTTWSADEITQFCQHWSAYCTGLGFDLTWVLNQKLEGTPLELELQQIALAYIPLYQQALAQHSEIANFKQVVNWRAQIKEADYQQLNQTLFIQLSHQQLISPPPVEVYCADEETRLAYMHKTLLKVSKEHLAEFIKALTEALS